VFVFLKVHGSVLFFALENFEGNIHNRQKQVLVGDIFQVPGALGNLSDRLIDFCNPKRTLVKKPEVSSILFLLRQHIQANH
jgi:hypothetical protein